MNPSDASFYSLTPDVVLDAIECVDSNLRSDGRLLALNSYENRVYQIGIDGAEPVVAKFYRPGRWSDAQIQEEHAFVEALQLQEIPVVPPLMFNGNTLHTFDGHRFALFAKRGGRAPNLDDPAVLEWIGRQLGRIHAVGATTPFNTRPALDIADFGVSSRDYLLEHDFLPPELIEPYCTVSAQALDNIRACFARSGEVTTLRLHGDCHPGNILWSDSRVAQGPTFVDFDDSRTGPAIQDLWMLLSGERRDMTRQLGDLLAGYEQFHDFDARELHLIEALRTLRLMHYAAWIARRWSDPAFPVAFPWFNTQRYWQDRILELREQVALMDEPPLWRA